jgi:hypothetical protein
MKISANLIFVQLLFSMPIFCQYHDFIWLSGYNDGNILTSGFGITQIDFDDNEPVLDSMEWNFFDFYLTDVVFSDSSGNLLFYSNGIDVWNAQHELMENGEWLNPGELATTWKNYGYPFFQGAIALPLPDSNNTYYLVHGPRINETDFLDDHMNPLYFSTIQFNDAFPLGEVVEKNIPVLSDTLDLGRITAIKHANGRDWWILVAEFDRISYYQFLLDPTGIHFFDLQVLYPDYLFENSSVGQSCFSPNGQYYVRHLLNNVFNHIELFYFDRCTGQLSNYRKIDLPELACEGGVAFSPNSRYLYIPSCFYLYRLDMWAPDIEASLEIIAEYDGFESIAPTYFKAAYLAPDGKIYINTPTGSNKYHIIHRPDEENPHIEQHGLHLLTINARSIPNNPHYRLGPLDGSPCDTLGLDNHPLARFTWFDTTLSVSFMDVSTYEPDSWHWDFGDGQESTLQNPVHTYADTGYYQVCLTASNVYSADTFCRWVHVQGTPAEVKDRKGMSGLEVFPNPAESHLTIHLPWSEPSLVQIFDGLGRHVQSFSISTSFEFDVSLFPPGYYRIVASCQGQMASAPFVILR